MEFPISFPYLRYDSGGKFCSVTRNFTAGAGLQGTGVVNHASLTAGEYSVIRGLNGLVRQREVLRERPFFWLVGRISEYSDSVRVDFLHGLIIH